MAESRDEPLDDLRALALASIAHRCGQECARFFKRLSNDPRFCFELFRRALEEQNQLAWQHVYRVFGPLVSGWVVRHPAFQGSGEQAGYFVNRAFERLWSAVPSEKFSLYTTLNALLSYLQMCVHSAIVDFARKLKVDTYPLDGLVRNPANPGGDSIETRAIQQIERRKLREEVSRRLKNEDERIVIHATFALGLKAREVHARYRDRFKGVGEIYLIRKNVLARLQRDLAFKELFGDLEDG